MSNTKVSFLLFSRRHQLPGLSLRIEGAVAKQIFQGGNSVERVLVLNALNHRAGVIGIDLN